MASAAAIKEVLTDLSPVLKVYTYGTVERFFGTPYIPPSPENPTNGIVSKDVDISSTVSARLYLPKRTTGDDPLQKLPILVYYHGGGFCIGSAFSTLDHHYMNVLSSAAGALIVSVEYRLAPKHPLPAAYDDSWEALQWVCSQKDEWFSGHGDFTRLTVGGDSAGANIAHHMVLRAGSDPLPVNVKIRGAILSHPYFLGSNNYPAGIMESEKSSNLVLLERIWLLVFPSAVEGIESPWINPFADGASSLSGLGCSRIQICVSEKDVLTNRAMAYAAEVRKCGWEGQVEVVENQGEDHCFHVFDLENEKAKKLIQKMASFISE